jgi:hypothetical protein
VVDVFGELVRWLLLAFLGAQVIIFVGLVLWGFWIDSIKPRLIPSSEIDREADAIIANYPDPELEAFARHERAWYRSDGAEQTYCYRVRKAVRRRQERA